MITRTIPTAHLRWLTLPTLPQDLLKLSKYRLSALVALTATAGYALRHEDPPDTPTPPSIYYRKLTAVTVGTWLTAACANTLNQIYERRTDALMTRTRLRPLPAARIPLAAAVAFAAATGLSGTAILASETNSTATGLAVANIALYAGVYTPLKRISTMNTWVGAVVGAIPPMLGWAAASNGSLSGERERGAWALGAYLFLWQIPHFHALAVVSRRDYAAAGLRMLAVADPVRNAMWARVTGAMVLPCGMLFVGAGVADPIFAWQAGVLGLWMYRGAVRMAGNPTSVEAARPLFKASIFHLPACLALLLANRVEYGREVPERVGIIGRGDRIECGEVRFHQPWEVIAPFPFLPVPVGVPAVVLERPER